MNLVSRTAMTAGQVSVKLGELKARATPSISILEAVAAHGSPRVRMMANEHLGNLYVAMAVRAREMLGGRSIVVGDTLGDEVQIGIAPWLAKAHDLFASVERDAKRQPSIARSDDVIRNVVAAAERELRAAASAVAVGQAEPPPAAARPVAASKSSTRAIAHKQRHARRSEKKAL